MQIRARMSMSADGYVTTPGGWPALTADPAFVSGESHGIREFLEGCEAALMGRTTFEPALDNDRWPWPNLNVFLLASQRPPGDPRPRRQRQRPVPAAGEAPRGQPGRRRPPRRRPAHDRGLPRLGALDKLELVVLPLLLGDGMRLTSSLSPDAGLTFESERALPAARWRSSTT